MRAIPFHRVQRRCRLASRSYGCPADRCKPVPPSPRDGWGARAGESSGQPRSALRCSPRATRPCPLTSSTTEYQSSFTVRGHLAPRTAPAIEATESASPPMLAELETASSARWFRYGCIPKSPRPGPSEAAARLSVAGHEPTAVRIARPFSPRTPRRRTAFRVGAAPRPDDTAAPLGRALENPPGQAVADLPPICRRRFARFSLDSPDLPVHP